MAAHVYLLYVWTAQFTCTAIDVLQRIHQVSFSVRSRAEKEENNQEATVDVDALPRYICIYATSNLLLLLK